MATVHLADNPAIFKTFFTPLNRYRMNNSRLLCIILLVLTLLLSPSDINCRKIKQSLKVKTDKLDKCGDNRIDTANVDLIRVDVCRPDSATFMKDSVVYSISLSSIRFAGYDKTLTASKESFHAINETPYDIMGMTLLIVYRDMKDRMLHSRKITIEKEIPHDETRKIDIPSWDNQKSFYYYMSNEPKRVAAPYKVTITPVSIIINY